MYTRGELTMRAFAMMVDVSMLVIGLVITAKALGRMSPDAVRVGWGVFLIWCATRCPRRVFLIWCARREVR
jgi:hypothetical protein